MEKVFDRQIRQGSLDPFVLTSFYIEGGRSKENDLLNLVFKIEKAIDDKEILCHFP